MRRKVYVRRSKNYDGRGYSMFASGRPGIDNFNLNAALDQLVATATNVSTNVQKNISAIDQIKTTVGAGVSGITNQVKSVFNGAPLPATPLNSPQTTYNTVAAGNMFPMLGNSGGKNWILIAGVIAMVVAVVMFARK